MVSLHVFRKGFCANETLPDSQQSANRGFIYKSLATAFFCPASSTLSSTVSDHDRIPVVTSLPPAVDGHLRCFLRVSIPTIHWTIPKYPMDVQVRLRWWGEDGDGVLFRYILCSAYLNKNYDTCDYYITFSLSHIVGGCRLV